MFIHQLFEPSLELLGGYVMIWNDKAKTETDESTVGSSSSGRENDPESKPPEPYHDDVCWCYYFL